MVYDFDEDSIQLFFEFFPFYCCLHINFQRMNQTGNYRAKILQTIKIFESIVSILSIKQIIKFFRLNHRLT
jgi:hypothetical protein